VVFSLRQGDVVQGSLQVAALDPKIDTRSPRTRDEVLQGLGTGASARPASARSASTGWRCPS
jgi:hypothetical protein